MLNPWWLEQCVALNPIQPATALWRAIELEVLVGSCLRLLGETRSWVLDVGCGDGSSMRVMKSQLPSFEGIVGVDRDPREAALAQAAGVYNRVYVCDASALPATDRAYDLVIANSSLEHIPLPKALAVLREIGRVVKAGGTAILTVPSVHFHELLRGPRLLRSIGYSRSRYVRYIDERLQHHYYWSQEEWCDRLAEVGLKPCEIIPYLTPREVRRWETISNLTAGVLYRSRFGTKKPLELLYALRLRRQRYPRFVQRMASGFLRLITRDLTTVDPPTTAYGGLLIAAKKVAS